MDVTARLAELSDSYALDAGAAGRCARLLELVDQAPLSLTTVRDPGRAVEIHIADSLTGLAVPALRSAASIADLGSGGGFPGLVLAAALPAARVTLVESVGKKATFLRAAANQLGLRNVTVVTARAEAWPDGIGAHDVVTARALATLNVLLEYAAPLLRLGGALVAWKSAMSEAELSDAGAAAALLQMSPPNRIQVAPEAVKGADLRYLYVSSKLSETPEGYPRREGMARKRPIQA